MTKIISFLNLLFIITASSFLSGHVAAATYRFSHNANDTSSWHHGALKFQELVKQKTDGKVTVRIFGGATLTGGDQMKQAALVSQGTIDFFLTSGVNVIPLIPEMAVFSLPYLYTNNKQVDASLAGEPGKKMAEILGKKNIVLLAWGENGFRELTNNVRPVKTPNDMKGLKLRVVGPMYVDIMNALGANPVQMQWGETVSALQQGVVDGQDNPIGSVIVPFRLNEMQKYMTTWHYSYDPVVVGVSRKLWDTWDTDTQTHVRAAAVEAMGYQKQLTRDVTTSGMHSLREQGMEIYEPNAEELQGFRDATKSSFDLWAKKVGQDLVDIFQKSIGQSN